MANLEYLLKLLRESKSALKELRSIANLVREVPTARTKGVGYFRPHNSKLSIREQLGLSKGAYNNLNKFLKLALEDYAYYMLSGRYRNKFIWSPKNQSFRYGKTVLKLRGEVPGLEYIASLPGATIRELFVRNPNGTVTFFTNLGLGKIGFTPKGYTFGELRATPEGNGVLKSIVLTSPRVDFLDSLPEATAELLAELPNRIPKESMRKFWDAVLQTTKPGTYLSGDAKAMPLGGFMIKAKSPSEAIKLLLTDAADKSSYINRRGLSPDSYKAIIKLGQRPEHRLRFSRLGFTELNNSAVDNKALYDLWKAATTLLLKELFVKDWNNLIYPRTAFINDLGVVEFLHPFSFYMKKGGKLNA